MIWKRYRFNKAKLQVVFEKSALNTFKDNIQNFKQDNERGGLLMGKLYPEENLVVVTNAIKIDSVHSAHTELYINLKEANRIIKKIWKKSKGNITYLGDWHTHPENKPQPSTVDFKTFKSTYFESKIDQNILLFAIVGRNNIEDKGICVGIQGFFKFTKLLYTDQHSLYTANKDLL